MAENTDWTSNFNMDNLVKNGIFDIMNFEKRK